MIELDAVTFGYVTAEPVVRSLSRRVEGGRMTALTGPSGRGKSTLLYLLGALLTPNSGRICVGGVDVTTLGDADRAAYRAASVGFMFQDAALDPTRTVMDNVLEGALYAGVGRRVATTRALSLLVRFGVERRADGRPGEISGGQAQRIGLCRALITRPSVVLADEPTGNLDRASADVVLTALSEAAREGAVVVVASHDPVVVARCDDRIEL